VQCSHGRDPLPELRFPFRLFLRKADSQTFDHVLLVRVLLLFLWMEPPVPAGNHPADPAPSEDAKEPAIALQFGLYPFAAVSGPQ
jgi:hypothetical protein